MFKALTMLAVGLGIIIVYFSVVWAWIVPDIFEGAVKAGLVPAQLSLGQVLKLTAIVAAPVIIQSFVGGVSRYRR